MDTTTPQKLYAYVDESGQDTEGRFYVVSVVLVGPERDTVLQRLEALEARSRKGRVKWRRARYSFRQDYITGLTDIPHLAASIFVASYRETRQYFDLTVESTARAITAKAQGQAYRVTIFVDGLTRHERVMFTTRLRARGIERKKVRGVRDEQSDAGIRLCRCALWAGPRRRGGGTLGSGRFRALAPAWGCDPRLRAKKSPHG